MAKAAPISETVDPNDAQAWFAAVLRVRFDEVLQYLDAALEPSGVDAVHDMRVAIRRLRSVLRDFASVVDKRPLSELTKALKRLAGMLGNVRDLDVMIEELTDHEKDAEGQVLEGVRLIIDDLIERRTRELKALENSVTGEFVLDLRTRFTASIESALRQRRLFEHKNVADEGSRTIQNCLEEFEELSDAFYRPFSINRLHRLRIAGKHLRYAIELFEPQFGEPLKPFADGMKKMQSHLGGIHDGDVWVERLRLIAARKAKSGSDRLKHAASVWLLTRFVERRTKSYASALALWSEWETAGFCAEMNSVVSRRESPE